MLPKSCCFLSGCKGVMICLLQYTVPYVDTVILLLRFQALWTWYGSWISSVNHDRLIDVIDRTIPPTMVD